MCDAGPARANAAPLAMGTLAAVMAAILPTSREVGLRVDVRRLGLRDAGNGEPSPRPNPHPPRGVQVGNL